MPASLAAEPPRLRPDIPRLAAGQLAARLDDPALRIIDSREDSLFNGFCDRGAPRGGHLPGAVQFPVEWLPRIAPERFEAFAAGKGIVRSRQLLCYDSDPARLAQVCHAFADRGYRVAAFEDYLAWAADPARALQALPNYHLAVSPAWLHALIRGERPEHYDNDHFLVFEVCWGGQPGGCRAGPYIPGACHFDTDWIENGPLWNLSEPAQIERRLLQNGITAETTVILYGDSTLAALRVLWALCWAGVKDVRFLNGGRQGWLAQGLPTRAEPCQPRPAAAFGGPLPANPGLSLALPADVLAARQQGLTLVSNRSWAEYLGQVSGYERIRRTGELPGAVWGFGGTDAYSMADFHDPDGTLRNPEEILALWAGQGIQRGERLAFYCGTGWRAAVAWFMTRLAGWPDTCVYDGGWNAWQLEPALPVQLGAPDNMAQPDARNDAGQGQGRG